MNPAFLIVVCEMGVNFKVKLCYSIHNYINYIYFNFNEKHNNNKADFNTYVL